VCCFTLGHAAATLRLSPARQIIARALAWISAIEEVRHGA
jgi:hypothetical protein